LVELFERALKLVTLAAGSGLRSGSLAACAALAEGICTGLTTLTALPARTVT
jgi:hypothetical protein